MTTINSSDSSHIYDYARKNGLLSDKGLLNLIRYYVKLKEGGDGELSVKIFRGKLTIKGVSYISVDGSYPEQK